MGAVNGRRERLAGAAIYDKRGEIDRATQVLFFDFPVQNDGGPQARRRATPLIEAGVSLGGQVFVIDSLPIVVALMASPIGDFATTGLGSF